MKIPLLILCLAVVYGACETYDEENFDLTKHNGDYKLDYANVPFEEILSRHRRASLLSPITVPLNTILRLAGFENGIISMVENFVKVTFGALMGAECPKIEKLSFNLCLQVFTHPIDTIQTVVCYIFQAIGVQGRALMAKMFELGLQLFLKVFLPCLHTTLNKIDATVTLPPQIKGMIVAFNLCYNFLKMMGYIPK